MRNDKNAHTLTKQFMTVIIIFICISIVMFGLFYISSYLTNAARAYVQGEGLWAKGQKRGIYYLSNFTYTKDPADWEEYKIAIQQSVYSAKTARRSILNTDPVDYKTGEKALIILGIDPNDTHSMLVMLRYFHTFPYIKDAITIWKEAEKNITELEVLAEQFKDAAQQNSTTQNLAALRKELREIDRQLTLKEAQFSLTLGQAARWLQNLLVISSTVTLILSITIGIYISRRIVRGINRSIDNEHDLLKKSAEMERKAKSSLAESNRKLAIERKKFESLIEDIGERYVVYSHTLEGYLLYVSAGIETVFGLTKEEIIGSPWQECIEWTNDSVQAGKKTITYLMNHKNESRQTELSFLHPDGEERFVIVTSHIGNQEGTITIDGIVENITENKKIEKRLRNKKNELEIIFNTSLHGIAVMTLDTKHIQVNEQYCKLFGYPCNELLQLSCYDLTDSEALSKAKKIFEQVLLDGAIEDYERLCNIKNGEKRWIKSSINLMPDREHFLMVSEDVTEGHQLLQHIQEQSITDELTQLHNRKALNKQLKYMIDQYHQHGITFSMLMLDIDFFKSINDTYGHQMGDDVLVALSKEMMATVRKTDYVYRFGGEEFVILLTGATLNDAAVFAEKLRALVKKNIQCIENKEITISIGVSEFRKTDTKDSFFKRADENLYRAKESGRNKVIIDT